MVRQISVLIVQLAQHHAVIVQKQGKSVESCGLAVLKREKTLERQLSGKLIQEDGRRIQNHAQQLLQYSLFLQKHDGNSINLYVKAVQEHINAIQVHIKAVSIYSSLNREKLKEIQARKSDTGL